MKNPWESVGGSSSCSMLPIIFYPYAPCMVYLPIIHSMYHTFKPNVGKYSIHGCYELQNCDVVFCDHVGLDSNKIICVP